MSTFTLQLQEKRQIARDIFSCTFRFIGPSFTWRAGQYLTMHIPSEGVVVERHYSIASHPRMSPLCEIIVKVNEVGVASDFFRAIQEGAQIPVSGPKGNFVVDSSDNSVVLIANGVGVAPVLPMLADLLEVRRTTLPVRLLFYKMEGAHPELEKYFTDFEDTHSNFNFEIIVDERPCTDVLHKEDFPTSLRVYVCGGTRFVEDMTQQLVKAGFPDSSIRYER